MGVQLEYPAGENKMDFSLEWPKLTAMSRRLPPLNSLRAFEAAARLLSFSKAADELAVTPAAISHQIKGLEDQLGAKVFRRDKQKVTLTEAGALLLPGLRDGFDLIAGAVADVTERDIKGVMTVSSAPSFAAKWLVPRLDRFAERHPEIDVRVSASIALVDFARDDVDVAVRYGSGQYPGLLVERLFPETVVPVCAPALLKGKHKLKVPADLKHHTLLHDDASDGDETCPDWRMWLKAAGVNGIDPRFGPRFNQSSLVLEAAILGRGVALAKLRLAENDLASGRLVRPFAVATPVRFAYFVVSPPARAERTKVAAFRAWLKEEAAATKD